MTPRAAVVDVGSNSVRLLLLEDLTPEGAVGERVSTVTALRRGAAPDGAVSPDALARLEECLAAYGARIAAAGGPPATVVGTAAVREAPNRDVIAEVVRSALGADLVVAPGEREAALSFAGARMALPPGSGRCRVVDIGGASTEVVVGGDGGPEHLVSLPLGVVRQADLPVDDARALARNLVAGATAGWPTDGPVLGVAGTPTQAAALVLGYYDADDVHRMRLTRDDLERLVDMVAAVEPARRRDIPGMHPDRADVILNGIAMLSGALDALGAQELMVSERDLLDGIAADPSLVPPGVRG